MTKDAEVIEGGFMACVTALLANESITLCPAVEEELEFQEQNTLHHGTTISERHFFSVSLVPLNKVLLPEDRESFHALLLNLSLFIT